jgi:putative transposase
MSGNLPERKPNRLKGYDYSSNGYYFVTLCTKDKYQWFGKIENGSMILNEGGEFAFHTWSRIPNYYRNAYIDEFIVMPDHIHGIIHINRSDRTTNAHYGLLSKIINAYKNITTKHLRKNMNNFQFAWLRSFYDRIIRDQDELDNVRRYIRRNAARYRDPRQH